MYIVVHSVYAFTISDKPLFGWFLLKKFQVQKR